MEQGDLLFFYLSGKMIIEAVGILDRFEKVDSVESLKKLVKKVSVYDQEELENFFTGRNSVTVLMFRLVTYLDPFLPKNELKKLASWRTHFQTITKLEEEDYAKIKKHGKGMERFIVH